MPCAFPPFWIRFRCFARRYQRFPSRNRSITWKFFLPRCRLLARAGSSRILNTIDERYWYSSVLYVMARAPRKASSRVTRTPRIPRIRERERFDLSIISDENEEIDVVGLEGMTFLLVFFVVIYCTVGNWYFSLATDVAQDGRYKSYKWNFIDGCLEIAILNNYCNKEKLLVVNWTRLIKLI